MFLHFPVFLFKFTCSTQFTFLNNFSNSLKYEDVQTQVKKAAFCLINAYTHSCVNTFI
jgi:hypothetical protein